MSPAEEAFMAAVLDVSKAQTRLLKISVEDPTVARASGFLMEAKALLRSALSKLDSFNGKI